MLKALYDYAQTHPEVWPVRGCNMRGLDFLIELDARGTYLGVRKSESKKVMAPNIPNRTTSPTANVIIEKAEIVVGLTDSAMAKTDRQLKMLVLKQQDFWHYIQENAAAIPAFDAILTACQDENTLNRILLNLTEAGCKPGQNITFTVDGVDLFDDPDVMAWWQNIQTDILTDVCSEQNLDIITGELCFPARIHNALPIDAAGGGQSSGVRLISFDKSAFTSFNREQGANAPMSMHSMQSYVNALTWLGQHGIKTGNMKVAYWYSEKNQSASSPNAALQIPDGLAELLLGVEPPAQSPKKNAKAKAQTVRKLYSSVFTGSVPPGLDKSEYHIILMKPNAARQSVQAYTHGPYTELYNAISGWFDDLRLIKFSGTGQTRNKSLEHLLLAITPTFDATTYDRRMEPVNRLFLPMLNASLYNRPVSEHTARLALDRIRRASRTGFKNDNDAVIPPETQCQILKLWLRRLPGVTQEEKPMEALRPDLPNSGYQAGRLLAVYERLQTTATDHENVASRYYAGCSARPAFVIPKLQKLANYYLAKLADDTQRDLFRTRLAEIYTHVDELPEKLSVQDQAYFALGYWHQMASMN